MVGYIDMYDLIFNGGYDCELLEGKPENGDPYLTVMSDPDAECGRGLSTIMYKGEVLADELMSRPNMDIMLEGPSVGLCDDARVVIMNDLQSYI